MNLNEICIYTERLVLKDIKLSDAECMFRYRSNPKVYQYQTWQPQSIEEVKDFITSNLASLLNTPNTWYQLGIFRKEDDEMLGDIGMHFIDLENSQTELGITISPGHQGKGYAEETLKEIIGYLFNALNKHRITASVDPRNVKSMTLLKKVGMRQEAHFRKNMWFNGDWADDVVFAILKEEWVR